MRRFINFNCLTTVRKASSEVFDRELKRRQRQFAYNLSNGDYYDYIRAEAGDRLLDRLDDITRTFPLALEIGSYRNHLLNGIKSKENYRGTGGGLGGIQNLVMCDYISRSEDNSSSLTYNEVNIENENNLVHSHSVVCDEEFLPFKEKTFDLVLSNLTLHHWVNDLPSTFKQIKEVLKPDGAFIGNMFVGETLKELRHCFYLAEQERRGGFSPHSSPMAKPSDCAYLMQNAGFALPAVDVDTITIVYPDAFTLMEHVVRMGEGSASLKRQFAVGRDTFLATAALYQELYGLEDGGVPATFEIVHMIGWSPDASQPKACKRGSASKSLKDI